MNAPNDIAAERLRQFIERIERLEEEKAAIAADIKDVFSEAKGTGFDPKVMRQILKLRKKTEAEIQEEQALLEIYMAALGMLGDTPLGQAAIRRLTRKPPKPGDDPPSAGGEAGGSGEPPDDRASSAEAPAAAESAPPEPTEADIEDAREAGRRAAREARPVTANAYPAGTRLRAAFDEGWCQAQGSDGMEVPEAWRRPKKAAKGDGASAPAAAGEQRPQP